MFTCRFLNVLRDVNPVVNGFSAHAELSIPTSVKYFSSDLTGSPKVIITSIPKAIHQTSVCFLLGFNLLLHSEIPSCASCLLLPIRMNLNYSPLNYRVINFLIPRVNHQTYKRDSPRLDVRGNQLQQSTTKPFFTTEASLVLVCLTCNDKRTDAGPCHK